MSTYIRITEDSKVFIPLKNAIVIEELLHRFGIDYEQDEDDNIIELIYAYGGSATDHDFHDLFMQLTPYLQDGSVIYMIDGWEDEYKWEFINGRCNAYVLREHEWKSRE